MTMHVNAIRQQTLLQNMAVLTRELRRNAPRYSHAKTLFTDKIVFNHVMRLLPEQKVAAAKKIMSKLADELSIKVLPMADIKSVAQDFNLFAKGIYQTVKKLSKAA